MWSRTMCAGTAAATGGRPLATLVLAVAVLASALSVGAPVSAAPVPLRTEWRIFNIEQPNMRMVIGVASATFNESLAITGGGALEDLSLERGCNEFPLGVQTLYGTGRLTCPSAALGEPAHVFNTLPLADPFGGGNSGNANANANGNQGTGSEFVEHTQQEQPTGALSQLPETGEAFWRGPWVQWTGPNGTVTGEHVAPSDSVPGSCGFPTWEVSSGSFAVPPDTWPILSPWLGAWPPNATLSCWLDARLREASPAALDPTDAGDLPAETWMGEDRPALQSDALRQRGEDRAVAEQKDALGWPVVDMYMLPAGHHGNLTTVGFALSEGIRVADLQQTPVPPEQQCWEFTMMQAMSSMADLEQADQEALVLDLALRIADGSAAENASPGSLWLPLRMPHKVLQDVVERAARSGSPRVCMPQLRFREAVNHMIVGVSPAGPEVTWIIRRARTHWASVESYLRFNGYDTHPDTVFGEKEAARWATFHLPQPSGNTTAVLLPSMVGSFADNVLVGVGLSSTLRGRFVLWDEAEQRQVAVPDASTPLEWEDMVTGLRVTDWSVWPVPEGPAANEPQPLCLPLTVNDTALHSGANYFPIRDFVYTLSLEDHTVLHYAQVDSMQVQPQGHGTVPMLCGAVRLVPGMRIAGVRRAPLLPARASLRILWDLEQGVLTEVPQGGGQEVQPPAHPFVEALRDQLDAAGPSGTESGSSTARRRLEAAGVAAAAATEVGSRSDAKREARKNCFDPGAPVRYAFCPVPTEEPMETLFGIMGGQNRKHERILGHIYHLALLLEMEDPRAGVMPGLVTPEEFAHCTMQFAPSTNPVSGRVAALHAAGQPDNLVDGAPQYALQPAESSCNATAFVERGRALLDHLSGLGTKRFADTTEVEAEGWVVTAFLSSALVKNCLGRVQDLMVPGVRAKTSETTACPWPEAQSDGRGGWNRNPHWVSDACCNRDMEYFACCRPRPLTLLERAYVALNETALGDPTQCADAAAARPALQKLQDIMDPGKEHLSAEHRAASVAPGRKSRAETASGSSEEEEWREAMAWYQDCQQNLHKGAPCTKHTDCASGVCDSHQQTCMVPWDDPPALAALLVACVVDSEKADPAVLAGMRQALGMNRTSSRESFVAAVTALSMGQEDCAGPSAWNTPGARGEWRWERVDEACDDTREWCAWDQTWVPGNRTLCLADQSCNWARWDASMTRERCEAEGETCTECWGLPEKGNCWKQGERSMCQKHAYWQQAECEAAGWTWREEPWHAFCVDDGAGSQEECYAGCPYPEDAAMSYADMATGETRNKCDGTYCSTPVADTQEACNAIGLEGTRGCVMTELQGEAPDGGLRGFCPPGWWTRHLQGGEEVPGGNGTTTVRNVCVQPELYGDQVALLQSSGIGGMRGFSPELAGVLGDLGHYLDQDACRAAGDVANPGRLEPVEVYLGCATAPRPEHQDCGWAGGLRVALPVSALEAAGWSRPNGTQPWTAVNDTTELEYVCLPPSWEVSDAQCAAGQRVLGCSLPGAAGAVSRGGSLPDARHEAQAVCSSLPASRGFDEYAWACAAAWTRDTNECAAAGGVPVLQPLLPLRVPATAVVGLAFPSVRTSPEADDATRAAASALAARLQAAPTATKDLGLRWSDRWFWNVPWVKQPNLDAATNDTQPWVWGPDLQADGLCVLDGLPWGPGAREACVAAGTGAVPTSYWSGTRWEPGRWDTPSTCAQGRCEKWCSRPEDCANGKTYSAEECRALQVCTRSCEACEQREPWSQGEGLCIAWREDFRNASTPGSLPACSAIAAEGEPVTGVEGLCSFPLTAAECAAAGIANVTYWTCDSLGRDDCKQGSGLAQRVPRAAALADVLRCEWSWTECATQEHCEASGDCDDWDYSSWGQDAQGQWREQREACVAPFQVTEAGRSCPAPQGVWNWHRVGCVRTDLSREACLALAPTLPGVQWRVRAVTEAQCLGHGQACKERHWWEPTPKQGAACTDCGGVVQPLHTWWGGVWRSADITPLHWQAAEWSATNAWTPTMEWGSLDNIVRQAVGGVLATRAITALRSKYSSMLARMVQAVQACIPPPDGASAAVSAPLEVSVVIADAAVPVGGVAEIDAGVLGVAVVPADAFVNDQQALTEETSVHVTVADVDLLVPADGGATTPAAGGRRLASSGLPALQTLTVGADLRYGDGLAPLAPVQVCLALRGDFLEVWRAGADTPWPTLDFATWDSTARVYTPLMLVNDTVNVNATTSAASPVWREGTDLLCALTTAAGRLVGIQRARVWPPPLSSSTPSTNATEGAGSGAGPVIACPAGTEGPAEPDCVPCNAGAYSPGPGLACRVCPYGRVANTTGLSSCTPCGGDTYAHTEGMAECILCPAGSLVSPGHTGCSPPPPPCPAGTEFVGMMPDPEGDVSASTDAWVRDCVLCPPGETSDAGGRCTPCPAGTFANATGMPQCLDCFNGTYAPDAGASTCLDCHPTLPRTREDRRSCYMPEEWRSCQELPHENDGSVTTDCARARLHDAGLQWGPGSRCNYECIPHTLPAPEAAGRVWQVTCTRGEWEPYGDLPWCVTAANVDDPFDVPTYQELSPTSVRLSVTSRLQFKAIRLQLWRGAAPGSNEMLPDRTILRRASELATAPTREAELTAGAPGTHHMFTLTSLSRSLKYVATLSLLPDHAPAEALDPTSPVAPWLQSAATTGMSWVLGAATCPGLVDAAAGPAVVCQGGLYEDGSVCAPDCGSEAETGDVRARAVCIASFSPAAVRLHTEWVVPPDARCRPIGQDLPSDGSGSASGSASASDSGSSSGSGSASSSSSGSGSGSGSGPDALPLPPLQTTRGRVVVVGTGIVLLCLVLAALCTRRNQTTPRPPQSPRSSRGSQLNLSVMSTGIKSATDERSPLQTASNSNDGSPGARWDDFSLTARR